MELDNNGFPSDTQSIRIGSAVKARLSQVQSYKQI